MPVFDQIEAEDLPLLILLMPTLHVLRVETILKLTLPFQCRTLYCALIDTLKAAGRETRSLVLEQGICRTVVASSNDPNCPNCPDPQPEVSAPLSSQSRMMPGRSSNSSHRKNTAASVARQGQENRDPGQEVQQVRQVQSTTILHCKP